MKVYRKSRLKLILKPNYTDNYNKFYSIKLIKKRLSHDKVYLPAINTL